MNPTNAFELPLGLGMALAQNSDAMSKFSTLPPAEKQQIIEHTHAIQSKAEMQQYVNSLFTDAKR